MGDMAQVFKQMRIQDKERKAKNLSITNPFGWTKHTDFHWSRELRGNRLDYWPSRNKFMYEGKVMGWNVEDFIKRRNKS